MSRPADKTRDFQIAGVSPEDQRRVFCIRRPENESRREDGRGYRHALVASVAVQKAKHLLVARIADRDSQFNSQAQRTYTQRDKQQSEHYRPSFKLRNIRSPIAA